MDLFGKELVKLINPSHLLVNLQQYGTLNNEDAEIVRAAESNYGRTRACWELIFLLPCRSETYFRDFMNCLIECDFNDVAKILEPDMYGST